MAKSHLCPSLAGWTCRQASAIEEVLTTLWCFLPGTNIAFYLKHSPVNQEGPLFCFSI